MGELKLLRQTGSVVDYQNKFLALLSCVDPLTDRQERQMFTTGLIEDLKDDVELAEPRDLDHVCTPTPTSSAGYGDNHGDDNPRAIRRLTRRRWPNVPGRVYASTAMRSLCAAVSALTSSSSTTTTRRRTTSPTTLRPQRMTTRGSPCTP